MGKKFMGYDNASELITAIGTKIKAKYSKPSGGIPKSDLDSAVQTSLGKADSAVQPATMTEALAAKQNSLNAAQLAAVNSGIDSDDVAQISTNQTNILYAIDTGVRNGVAFTLNDAIEATKQEQSAYHWSGNTFYYNSGSSHTVSFTVNDDCSITVNGSTTGAYNFMFFKVAKMSNFKNCVGAAYINNRFVTNADGLHFVLRGDVSTANVVFDDGTDVPNDLTNYSRGLSIRIDANKSFDNVRIYPLISPKTAFEADNTYKAPAKPNYDLTRLQSEDRAGLIDVVDSGAKNKFDLSVNYTTISNNITVNKTSNSITVTSQNSGNYSYVSYPIVINKAGTYVMKATFSDITAGSNSARLRLAGSANGDNPVYTLNGYEAGTFFGEFTINTAGTYYMIFAPNWSSSTVVNSYKASDILVCTKAAFCVSQKFVAYRPSYDDLIAQSTYTTSTSSTSITNLLYKAANALGISPTNNIHFFMVSVYSDASDCLVICGAYQHGTIGYGVSMASKNITFEGTVNNLGTVGWTGGTSPYHVQVRFF